MTKTRIAICRIVVNVTLLSLYAPNTFSQGLMDLRDRPICLPSYHGSASLAGVTGTVKLRARFNNGKVRLVQRVSSELTIPPLPRDSGGYVSLIEDKLIEVVKQWESFFLNPFTVDVTFEFRQTELPGNQRSYLLEYDERGVTTRVVITDPISSRKLRKE